jgi:Ras-related protein Rab-1A
LIQSSWDTAGQDRFRTITEAYYRGAHGILLVYDTTNRESFQNIQTWLDDVKKHQGDQKSALILVGNKTDLKHRKKISTDEGEELAKQLEFDAFIETSAKSGDRVQQAFELILQKVLENQTYLQPVKDGKIRINPPKPKIKPQKTSFWSWCSIL